MKQLVQIKKMTSLRFVIQYDEKAGYYLYAYLGDFNLTDDLQDNFTQIANQAFQEYDIPIQSWVQTPADPTKWTTSYMPIQPLSFVIEQEAEQINLVIYRGQNPIYQRSKKTIEDVKKFASEKFDIQSEAWG